MGRDLFRHAAAAVCCLMLLGAAQPATALEFLDKNIQSQLTHASMNGDFFQRIDAVSRDAQAQGIPVGKTFGQIWNALDTPSTEAVAASLENHTAIRNLLARHSLGAHDFVIGTLLLERSQYAAAGLIDKQKLNPQNLRFYDQHKAQADKTLARLMDAGAAKVADGHADDSNSHNLTLEDMRKMDKQMLAECTQVGIVVAEAVFNFGIAAMDSHYPEAGSIDGDTILGISENLRDLAADVPQEDLKNYLSTMSTEIGRQAHIRPIQQSPAYLRAGDAYTAWMDSHCTKEALAR
jgi:hypothetical protein